MDEANDGLYGDDHDDAHLGQLIHLLGKSKFAMMVTMGADGAHHSRPMTLQQTEFDGDLWFFADDSSEKAADIAAHPQVNIAVSEADDGVWISLSGTAQLVHDKAKAAELWNKSYEMFFPQGLDDPHLALIKVNAESAEYWASSSSKVVRLVKFVKGAITGDAGDLGDNETVLLNAGTAADPHR